MPRMQDFLLRAAAIAACTLLLACSPKFDWREVRGSAAPYVALFPAKPDTHARAINLDGAQVTMTMTGAEIDGVSFTVASIDLGDPTRAQQAIGAMKTALVRNIDGQIVSEQLSAPAPGTTLLELEARGPLPKGGERLLLARFFARENHAYQMLVVGHAEAVSREAANTFLTSFQLP